MVANFNNKLIHYNNDTEFLVQYRKKSRGAYKTKYRIVGNFYQALMLYNGLNINDKYNKRLYMPSCSFRPVIHRTIGI